MKVANEITIYEIDGDDKVKGILLVSSHWNYHDFVVIGDGKQKITVNANDLMKAIQNATNW